MTFSLFNPRRPSAYVATILLVAPAPVGAPFAMSTLGAAPRKLRAPAMPSSTQRANDRVNVVASIVHGDDVLWARPSVPAIIGFDHCVRADAGSACAEMREEEIDYPVAVGTDCCALTETVLSEGSCLGDLFGCPSIPTV